MSTSVAETYDQIVREDIELFRQQAQQFQSGAVSADEFRGSRLRRGVYGQRQDGVHMIRTKVPGGVMESEQMDRLADVADEFAGGRGHLTTRQNMQFHFVPLAKVADLLHRLADVRLTTREACYNTVRNVTADPFTGLMEDEVFDVAPWVRKIAFAFLHRELTDNMPRKFKIAICSRPGDRMAGAMHDIALEARIKDGQQGFRVLAGGGLGPLPVEAIVLDEFLPADRVISRIEAVLRIFNEFGNRKNKHKARLKFIIRERTAAWFLEQVEKQYADILANGGIPTPTDIPEGFGAERKQSRPLANGNSLPVLAEAPPDYSAWLQSNVWQQKAADYRIVHIMLDSGNMSSSQMRAIAQLSRDVADGIVRVTIDQNLALAWVPAAKLRDVYGVLRANGLALQGAGEISDVVTCPGAWTCNLGITKTMNLGAALVEAVRGYDDPAIRGLRIKASGCPNSCGQHWIGDFGFFGNKRSVEGKEMPYYQMLLGGGYDESGIMRFGYMIQSIPARLAPEAVHRVIAHYQANRVPGESFRQYVERHKVETFRALTADLARPTAPGPELYQDWGDNVPFSVDLGRGECGV
jgi:sulfite reductase beta subunit-like hemoprotein